MSFDPDVNVSDFRGLRDKHSHLLIQVDNCVVAWLSVRQVHQSIRPEQLRWEAHVVEYVNYVSSSTAVSTGQPKTGKYKLPLTIPLWGPVFSPPTFADTLRQPRFLLNKTSGQLEVKPNQAYLRPMTVIHPHYFLRYRRCPRNASHRIINDGWQASGSREVHGVSHEETAIGYQVRCLDCKGKQDKNGKSFTYCFSLTNAEYWDELKEDYRILSAEIPRFLHKCALTQSLFNMIIELRLPLTALGLETHIELAPFSAPRNVNGYADGAVSHEIITEVYLQFGTLQLLESSQYLRMLEAVTLSFDHTFRIARKATLMNKDGSRERVWKGGMFSAINEKNEIVLYRFDTLGVSLNLIVVADNCCTVAGAVTKNLPGSFLGLDLKHFKGRYEAVILGGVHNPHRGAKTGNLLEAAYQKWFARGGVWSEAAAKAHAIQMGHVQKGCLSRPRNDVRSDGSRIEGSHKGWNSLQRANPSGYEVIIALAGNHVLRRNIRIIINSKEFSPSSFITSTFGCHHLALVDHIARLWNTLLEQHNLATAPAGIFCLANCNTLEPLPVLIDVPSGETFGAVTSSHASTFGGLLKLEDVEDDDLLDGHILDEESRHDILCDMNIDPRLAHISERKVFIPIDPTLLNSEQPHCSRSPLPHISLPHSDFIDNAVKYEVADTTLEVATCSSKGKAREIDISTATRIVDLTSDDGNNTIKAALEVPSFSTAGSLVSDLNLTEQPPSDAITLPSGGKRKGFNNSESSATSSKKARITTGTGNVTQTSVHRFFASQMSIAPMALVVPDKGPVQPVTTEASPSEPPSFAFTPVSTQLRHVKPLSTITPAKSLSASPSTRMSLEALSEKLPLPDNMLGLTRSARLFKIHTGIDPTALKIGGGAEYYLFMDLHQQHQWASHRMNSHSYVEVTQLYNDALAIANKNRPDCPTSRKNPCAIMDKLGEVEAEVLDRIRCGDFVAKRSGTPTFWTRHCAAVNLVSTNTTEKKRRTASVCSRCQMVMHPGKEGAPENHKRGLCLDGVPTHMAHVKYGGELKLKTPETTPLWPQPVGVFTKLKNVHHFHPFPFLAVVRHMYEKVVIKNDAGVLTMEHEAFADMLLKRVEVIEGKVFFRLYPQLVLPTSTPASLIEERNGRTEYTSTAFRTESHDIRQPHREPAL
ncbi:hypothetical protein BC835DRAFT_1311202 [Cytidiella melzeri]|nr:hypothetical protein BC835DRAFT_1311202 [Cytidiella melzeri]